MAAPAPRLTEDPLARRRRALHPVLPALVVALPALAWVMIATYRASYTTLGRDQGIFQYVAWAVLDGAKDYRDVRDVNGPLTHLIHMVLLKLGGADEHRFRFLDLAITGATFALAGACLPGIGRRPVPSVSSPQQLFTRLAWAFAAWVILGGQYVLYSFWDLAQRESFFDWFLLSSVALQLSAQAGLRNPAAKWPRWVLGFAFALSVVPWFGKPTYALFTVAQAAALIADDELAVAFKTRVRLLASGAAAGAATQVLFLVVYADVAAFARIYLVDVPTMYRFIWPRGVFEILSLPSASAKFVLAIVSSTVLLGLIWKRQVPRRALAVALVPVCGLAGVFAQGKGFSYHFHPVTAGMHLQWLLLVVWLSERPPGPSRGLRLAPLLAGAALSLRVALAMAFFTHAKTPWSLRETRGAEERSTREYFVHFQIHDFFPWEMRETAAYLRAHTKRDERVQLYGMDPYVLFLAERRSATPFIYAYDLNADAALAGSILPEPAGLHPNQKEAARIRALRDAHEKDLSARLHEDPPAAFVFVDKSPLLSREDAWLDFRDHNVQTAAWIAEHYRETAEFGADHVWLRIDLAEPMARPPSRATP